MGSARFFEVFAGASAEWCEKRDKTGLYARARRGEIKNFAGVNAPYDIPVSPAIALPVEEISTAEAVNRILTFLRSKGVFPSHA